MHNESFNLKDYLFGKLEWNSRDGQWESSVLIPYFKRFGANLQGIDLHGKCDTHTPMLGREYLKARLDILTSNAKDRPFMKKIIEKQKQQLKRAFAMGLPPFSPQKKELIETDRLFRQGKFLLTIPTNPPMSSPTRSQRIAWEKLLKRGHTLWDELLERLLIEYVAHRELRIHWWKATFGDYQIDDRFLEVTNTAALKKLFRPISLCIKSGESGSVTHIIMFIYSTYGEFGVVIDNGKITDFADVRDLVLTKYNPGNIQHAIFGELHRGTSNGPWIGYARCEPFRIFKCIVEDRAQFKEDPGELDPTVFTLPWNFAQGDFNIKVSARKDKMPTEKQAVTFAEFCKHKILNASLIIDAVLHHYAKTWTAARRKWMKDHVNKTISDLGNVDDPRELIELYSINVFPPNKQGDVDLGFEFIWLWGVDGIGVRWRNGRVAEVGLSHIAKPSL